MTKEDFLKAIRDMATRVGNLEKTTKKMRRWKRKMRVRREVTP